MKREVSFKLSLIILILILVLLPITVYFTFFYTMKCENLACWETKLSRCQRARFVNDGVDMVWSYRVIGKSGDKCIVKAKVLDIKRGLTSVLVLKGKEMTCYLPLTYIDNPEKNPNLCHGELKEEMQAIMIQKLHEYIIQNIGRISDNLKNITNVIDSQNISK
ncbi:MAG: hypothetical protein QXJ28_00595 [Candidatus Pacearchaeota archaeon]